MSNVEHQQVGTVATVFMGQSPPSSACTEGGEGLPFVQGNAEFGARIPTPALRCSVPTRIAERGDLLLSVRAPVGALNQASCRLVIGRGLSAIRFPEADQRFAWHALRWRASELDRVAQGTTFLAVSRNDVEDLLIPWPSRSVRDRTSQILDRIDAAIEKTASEIAKLDHIRIGLLAELFTHGVEDDGMLRSYDGASFVDTALGPLPQEWRVACLDDVSDKIQDGTHFSPQSSTGRRRYVTSKNIRFGYMDLAECGWISEDEHRAIYSRCDVRKSDVLLTKDGANTGNAAIMDLDEQVSLLSSVSFIRCRPNTMFPDFLLHYLLSPVGQKRLKDLMSGNAITRLTLEKIRAFTVPVAPYHEQIRIAEVVNHCIAQLNGERRFLEKLRMIKSGVMEDLLSGRVPVRVPEQAEVAV